MAQDALLSSHRTGLDTMGNEFTHWAMRRLRVVSGLCACLLLGACAFAPPAQFEAQNISLQHTSVERIDLAKGTLPTPAIEPPPPPQVITDMWVHLRNNMHLELHLEQKRVQQELAWLKRHPSYLNKLQTRLQTYLPYIYREVALRNMPVELALLPVVESALDVYAFSHGGAAGPWQFIRGTARQYNLVMDDWYDGRRDIVASTDAALHLLSDLHNRYDDWYLALAGYNAGPGNVNRALRKNPNAGFFDLALPRETRAYVPRLLALVAVIKDPQNYGIELPKIENTQQFAALHLGGQFQIDKAAAATGLSMSDFRHWNPAYSRWATSPRGPHHIIVPLSIDIESAQAAINAIPAKQRLDWQEIKVKSGDTMSQIARRYRTDVRSLLSANNMRTAKLRAGQRLIIPVAGQQQAPAPIAGASHKVRPGDSLWSISRHYDISMTRLMKLNHIGPKDPLSVGATLKLPGIAPTSWSAKQVTRKVRYKVRRGDSLARIASKFNVSIAQISRWNALDPAKYLQPGQGLLLYVNVTGTN